MLEGTEFGLELCKASCAICGRPYLDVGGADSPDRCQDCIGL